MRGRFPRRLLLSGLAAAVVVGGTYTAFSAGAFGRRQQLPVYATAAVTRSTLQVSVSATGPITNPQSVPLSFKSAGKLARLDVSVGDPVKAGQVLGQLDTSDLEAQLAQAQAALDAQIAGEAKTEAGATPEQVDVANAQVASAHTTLDGSQQSLATTQASVYAAVAASEADVRSAQATLAADQQALADAQSQMDAVLQSDITALNSARQAYADQSQSFHANWDQVEAQLKQDQVSVQNAQKTLDDAALRSTRSSCRPRTATTWPPPRSRLTSCSVSVINCARAKPTTFRFSTTTT